MAPAKGAQGATFGHLVTTHLLHHFLSSYCMMSFHTVMRMMTSMWHFRWPTALKSVLKMSLGNNG